MKTFEDFFTVPVWFYRKLGNSAEPFGYPFNCHWKQVLYRGIFFTFLFLYFVAMVATGYTVVLKCISLNIPDILASTCCLFFCSNGLLKESFFYRKLRNVLGVAAILKDIYTQFSNPPNKNESSRIL